MEIEILESDLKFTDSPDPGDPTRICSRCQKTISETDIPLLCWTQNMEGEVDENSYEYRFCETCQGGMGIKGANKQDKPLGPIGKELIDWIKGMNSNPTSGTETIRKCRQCGCSELDACYHPQHGNCWWVEDDLCSHCQNWPGEAVVMPWTVNKKNDK